MSKRSILSTQDIQEIFFLIRIESRTLARGLTVCFIVILPFTFLPVLFEEAFTAKSFPDRVPASILYSLGFSLLIVLVAVINNFHDLKDKKWYFDQPAFKSLDFYGRLDGLGSITYSLDTFLLGKLDQYFFRLQLANIEEAHLLLEIIPLVDLNEKEGQADILIEDYGFIPAFFFYKKVKLSDIDLQNPDVIRQLLTNLTAVFHGLGLEGFEIDEHELENDLYE